MICMDSIQDIRIALSLTQAEMADALGLHQSTISRFELGILPLDKRTLLAAKALLDAKQSQGAKPKGIAA